MSIHFPPVFGEAVEQALTRAIAGADQTGKAFRSPLKMEFGFEPREVTAKPIDVPPELRHIIRPDKSYETYFKSTTPMAEADFSSPWDVHGLEGAGKPPIGDVLDQFLKWGRDSKDAIDISLTAGGVHGYNRSSRNPQVFHKQLARNYPDLYKMLDPGYIGMAKERPGMFSARTSVKVNRPGLYDPVEAPLVVFNPENMAFEHKTNRELQDHLTDLSDYMTNAYRKGDPRELMGWASQNVHPEIAKLIREKYKLSALLGALGTGALASQGTKESDEV
jgi:hypothetical protein